jgi:hypothetical protein
MSDPEIPNFTDPQFDDLLDNLSRGACIFFGAGISKLAGYKLWNELAKELIARFERRKRDIPTALLDQFDHGVRLYLKNAQNEIEIFDHLFHLSNAVFYDEIENIFLEDEKISTYVAYNQLSKFLNGKNFFLTTNIDRGYQAYLGLDNSNVAIVPYFTRPPMPINYLHGRVDQKDSWAFTGAQYYKFYYDSDAPCRKFLTYVADNFTILFIGYGLRERDILDCLRSAGKKRKHYWLESSHRDKQSYLKIKSTCLREDYNMTFP